MANLLQYRGYYGSIEASPEDNCLYGKLLYIQALVNYEAETVAARLPGGLRRVGSAAGEAM
jgi:predicted HicB family RNase H-like nuclease